MSQRSARSAAPVRPRPSSQPTSRRSRTASEREVEGVGLGVGADGPRRSARGPARGRRRRRARRAGQGPGQVDGDAGAPTPRQIAAKEVHPEGRLAERLQDDRREPAEEDVGREAGRVGRAQQRPTVWNSPVSQKSSPGSSARRAAREHDDPDERSAATARARVDAGAAHHPRSRPQTTPQTLTAIETTTRAMPSGIAQPTAAAPAAPARARRAAGRTARSRC